MPHRRTDTNPQQGASFPEAVAQWRLALRTEVKSSSSLPTTVFHTRDAMLEALIAERTETMLAQLHEPVGPVAAPSTPGEQRIEIVLPDELSRLPQRLRDGAPAHVEVDDHLTAESLAVLTDACFSGHETAAIGATWLLRRHFGIAADAAPEDAAAQLATCLRAVVAGHPDADANLADVCRRIAAEIAAASAAASTAPDDEPRGDGGGA
jgi:hypothetical protein